MRGSLVHVAVALFALTACASAGASGGSSSPRRAQNVITADELATVNNVSDAYEAVRHLRPRFLQSRGNMSLNGAGASGEQPLPAVFLDGQRLGGVEELRNILVSNVKEIRYISASDATTRWGTGYPNGVIEVTSKGG